MIKEKILDILTERGIALSAFDLTDLAEAGMELVQPALNELCEEGRAVITKKGKYAVPQVLGLIPAKASALRNGAPLALPLDGGTSMKVLYPGRTRCMMDDLILVRRLNDEECELVSVTRRGKREIPAFIHVEVREIRMPKSKQGRHGKHGKIPPGRGIPHSVPGRPDGLRDAAAERG